MKAFEAPGIGEIQLLDDISSARFYESIPEIIIILETIKDYVNMALIQHRRIFIDLEHLIKRNVIPRLGPHGIHGQPILALGKALKTHTTVLFGDIHYYIICWDKIGKLRKELELLYLFSWNKIPGNDSEKLADFLKQKFSIDWVKTAKIEKIDNGKGIKLSTGKNFILLKLNTEKTKLNIEIDDFDDVKTDEFIAKKENDKLNIYKIRLLSVNYDRLKTYDVLFDNHRKIRNSFEHMDERIRLGIHEIGEFDGIFFTSFNGHKVDLKNGEKHLRDFYGNLLETFRESSS